MTLVGEYALVAKSLGASDSVSGNAATEFAAGVAVATEWFGLSSGGGELVVPLKRRSADLGIGSRACLVRTIRDAGKSGIFGECPLGAGVLSGNAGGGIFGNGE